MSIATLVTDECLKCIELKERINIANRDIEQIRLLKIELDVEKFFSIF